MQFGQVCLRKPLCLHGYPPAMAFLFGPAFTAVLLVFLNTPFTAQTWATVVLAGVVAAAGAIGVTLLQRKAT